HEHFGKEILKKYGVNVLSGFVAFNVDEAVEAAGKLDSSVYVVKAQIYAGGRGKAGGVKVVKDMDGVKQASSDILGKTLVTPQTGPEGKVVNRLYIEAGCDIVKEYYLSVLLDRVSSKIIFIASSEGGTEIEEIAASNPEKIISTEIDPATGVSSFHCRKLSYALGITDKAKIKEFSKFVQSIYQAFIETDANQIEINPLVEDASGNFIALDAKFNFDDNALYRQAEIVEMRDPTEEEESERAAEEHGLSYIKMDGNIGCMVNGAGLAMATMDIIKYNGGNPANFLDVGGGATKEKVTEAFKIILSDPHVEGILVNIFGGIMRCDVIAEGIIAAAKDVSLNVPLVVRLEGTNVEEGKNILSSSGLSIISANDLGDAAVKIVNSIKREAA
ncbi:MAG: ADP-forming succinate--CoA ligase subunit beta, partial [Pseudomonadota bacterium]